MEQLAVYEGREPYLFLSYAHADAPAVLAIAARLQRQGFRIWYDAGLVVGSEWPEYIAAHLAGAAVMVAFLSEAYSRSENCRKELHYAMAKKIPTVNIFLERANLSPGLEMQVGNLFALMKYEMSEEQFYRRFFSAPQLAPLLSAEPPEALPEAPREKPLKPKKKRAARIAALCVLTLLVAAAITLGTVGHFTGLTQRLLIRQEQTVLSPLPGDTVAVFRDESFERAARAFTGTPEGEISVAQLNGLTELSLEGEIADLSDLRYFTGCRSLSLRSGALRSLETLPACTLETLRLTNCPLTSLEGIGSLPALRELYTENCPLRELGDLSHCLELRLLSLEGADVSSFQSLRPLTRLAELSLSNCALHELRPLLGLSSLSDLRFTDCDLRGRFFYAFDRESAVVSLSLINCELNSTANLDDFTGLTELTLIDSGARLDWSALVGLPALRTVSCDAAMESALRPALEGSGIELSVLS